MADILAGQSAHSHHAPLSHAQTLAISKHLQEQITLLSSRLADLSLGLGETKDSLTKVHKTLGLSAESAQALHEAYTATKHDLESTKKDLNRTCAAVQDIKSNVRKANGEITAVQEGQKVTNVNLDKVGREALQTHKLSLRLRDDVEKRVTDELSTLDQELRKLALDLQQVRGDESTTRALVVQQRDSLRETNLIQAELQDSLGKTDTHLGMIEHRLSATSTFVEEDRKQIESLSATAARLQEKHDHTGMVAQANQATIKKLSNATKTNRDVIDHLKTNQVRTEDKLEEVLIIIDAARQDREQNRHLIDSLKQSAARAQTQMEYIRGELAENNATTLAVKQGLKEASTLLLPNIHTDSSEAQQAIRRHGSILQSDTMARLHTAPTPRRAANTSRLGMSGTAEEIWT